jgi:hypothetical protein
VAVNRVARGMESSYRCYASQTDTTHTVKSAARHPWRSELPAPHKKSPDPASCAGPGLLVLQSSGGGIAPGSADLIPRHPRASDRDPEGGDPRVRFPRGSVRAGTVVSCPRE